MILSIYRCFLDGYQFLNEELLNIWILEKNYNLKTTVLANFVLDKIQPFEDKKVYYKAFKQDFRNLSTHISTRWRRVGRDKNRFKKKYSSWLTNYTIFKKLPKKSGNSLPSELPSETLRGRPSLNFNEKSLRSQRRDALNLSRQNNHDSNLMVKAATVAAKQSGKRDLSILLKEATGSPSRPTKIRNLLLLKNPISYSPQEALAFMLDNGFTKQQYLNIRMGNKEHNSDIFPAYEKILKCKEDCRPLKITVTETSASVSLEDLLNHTIGRIVLLQEDVLFNVFTSTSQNCITTTMILSYGFDGSSGQSLYKQTFANFCGNDSSIFATTLIPLRLISNDNIVIWNNPTPQSVRFCRPIKLEYVKETKDHVLKEKQNLDDQIQHLDMLVFNVRNFTLKVKCHLCMTLIDGKTLATLTNTKSSQACQICGATPADFLKISDFRSVKFMPKSDSLQYGISPLHCWIRFLECILHIAYRIELKVWQIRGESRKQVVALRKTLVQKKFYENLGLHVDKPKQNYGSTNDGNTARRAFEKPCTFAEITGVSVELILKFRTILIAMACQLPIDANKFETLCFQTGALFRTLYPWFPMPATVHKVLIHGKQILDNCLLPLGYLGEDAAESRNKFYKQDRLHHARKIDRISNLKDVFCRALDTSDPIISNISVHIRKSKLKTKKLPAEVIELLKPFETVDFEVLNLENSKDLNLEEFEELLGLEDLNTLELDSELT